MKSKALSAIVYLRRKGHIYSLASFMGSDNIFV